MRCSRDTLILQNKIWTNVPCLVVVTVFVEALREQRIGMVMQGAAGLSQQDGGGRECKGIYVKGAGLSSWPPKGIWYPRAGLGVVGDPVGDGSGPAGPRRPAALSILLSPSPCPSVPPHSVQCASGSHGPLRPSPP